VQSAICPIDYLNSTININPKNINAMYALGLFYQEHSMMQKALDMYQSILKISFFVVNLVFILTNFVDFDT
jgi:Tfp pilus assembly protein PilF